MSFVVLDHFVDDGINAVLEQHRETFFNLQLVLPRETLPPPPSVLKSGGRSMIPPWLVTPDG